MKISPRHLSLILLLAFAAQRARAQAVYGMFSASHYSGVNVGNAATGTSGGITPLGGTFGFYSNLRTPGPIKVGADVRLILENSANSTPYGNKLTGGLVGLRVAGDVPLFPVSPYAQVEIGGVGQNNGNSYDKQASFAYQFQFGGDFGLVIPHLKGRLEYGAGQLATGNGTNHTLQTFGAGIVLILPPLRY